MTPTPECRAGDVGDSSAPEAIRDAVTNSILFIGRVEDPTL